MAKWGEGDPRWIVEERPDATNVNNWHWTEKNAIKWSKEKLLSLFKSISIDEPNKGTLTVTDMVKCEGDAWANNRKGKLILLYDLEVELEWMAKSTTDPDNEIIGKVNLLNLSDENQPNEIEIEVSLTKGGEAGFIFKELMRTKGHTILRDKIAIYIKEFKEEYASDIILPTACPGKTQVNKTKKPFDLDNNVKTFATSMNVSEKPTKAGNTDDGKLSTMSLTMNESFKCTAVDLYNVLTEEQMLCIFTRNKVKTDSKKGGKFELFDGNVTGEFIELEKNKIIQKWRFKTWPKGHFSQVTFKIEQTSDSTKLDMKQTGIPSNDLDRTREGWRNYYWEPIKRNFGFGVNLY